MLFLAKWYLFMKFSVNKKMTKEELSEIEEKIIKLRDKANKCIEKKDFVSLSIIGKDLRKLKKRLELANKNV